MVTPATIAPHAEALSSCLYVGSVRHRRFAPKPHAFRYSLMLTLLDLDELDRVFRGRWLWSVGRRNLAWFRRADYFDGAATPLADAVRGEVQRRTGKSIGAVRLLTQLRTFGTCFNPISLYFCYAPETAPGDAKLEAVVAEVTNTPWHERHRYILDTLLANPAAVEMTAAPDDGPQQSGVSASRRLHYRFAKNLHVSPFLDMGYVYDLRLNEPSATLTVHLENLRLADAAGGNEDKPLDKIHDATLTLERREITGANLARALAAYPFQPARVVGAIYWQALRLWLKGVPFVPHPGAAPSGVAESAAGD
jgi:uncharacterized protein